MGSVREHADVVPIRGSEQIFTSSNVMGAARRTFCKASERLA